LLLVAVAACSSEPSGKPLPDARLPAIGMGGLVTNKFHDLSSFRGKVMVIDLWATWCPPCRVALPLVEQEVAPLKDEVVSVSICTDGREQPTRAREMVQELAPTTLLLADTGAYADAVKVTEIPAFIVVDREGRIVGEHSFKGEAEARAFLGKALAAARER